MKIITQNAIAALYAKAEEMNQQSTEGWKCIYFNIPTADERRINDLARFDANVLAHMLSRMNGFAYLCETGEIFILYRGTYNSLTSRLSMYLWSLCSTQNIVPTDHQLFSHFDLRGQWKSFYRFCEKRYYEALAISEERKLFTNFAPLPAELMCNEHVAGYLNSK